MDSKYIYGIISGEQKMAWDIGGAGGSGSVYTVPHQGLSCVLSDYQGSGIRSLTGEEVIRSLLAHQRVVERVMRRHAVLPVKFGTVLASLQEVDEMLDQGRQRLRQALAWMGDKVEVEVAATWDLGQVLREVSAEPAVVQARQALARDGGPTQEGKITLGRLVKACLDQRRDAYRQSLSDLLEPFSVDAQPNALLSDEMVMNVAFLVETACQEEFDRRVRQQDELSHSELHFRIVGPLPPYSFATVEVSRPCPEKVEESRRLLHLGEAFSEMEVRKAYRCLAAETHPDGCPGDGAAKVQFLRLREAADLLLACCRGREEGGGNWLISIARRRDEEISHFRSGEMLVGVGHG